MSCIIASGKLRFLQELHSQQCRVNTLEGLGFDKWDIRFINLAYQVATWSKDPDKNVGCVLVHPNKKLFSFGYNGFPRYISDDTERLASKNTKNSLTIHAEVNAVLNAATSDIKFWCAYTTTAPCLNCSLVLIQKGISKIVYPKLDKESRWFDNQKTAQALMHEAGIEILEY